MDQKTETIDTGGFYDRLAPDYDHMTGFEGRFVRERSAFKSLVDNHRILTALDAGCGTGFHSLLLARLGVAVTAVDLSAAMLDGLRRHAEEEGRAIRLLQASFQELRHRITVTFDGVFCMGNALAHALTERDRRTALANFSALIAPGGLLVLQLLNFGRILEERPRVLSTKSEGGVAYTRYYEYADPLILFNIAKVREGSKKPEEVITTALRPVLWQELRGDLEDAGFGTVRAFGSIAMTPFEPAASRDLVVLASTKRA